MLPANTVKRGENVAGYQINPESNIDKKMKTVKYFNMYFDKFKYIFISNIYFLVFFIISIAYIYFSYQLFNGLNIIAALGSVVILNTGMSGVTAVVRYIYTGKEFSPFKTFLKGIKENWLKFLFHGIFFYFFIAITYASVSLYYQGTKTNSLFWVPLVITSLISLLVLFMTYYLNIMTATMKLDLKTIYRNCMLFSFGELKNNLMATFALLVFGAVILTAAVIVNNLLWILIICGIITALLAPSTVQFIITFYVYDAMIDILDESKKNEEETAAEHKKIHIEKDEAEKISKLASDSKDEYIFYNGKMVKRSAVEESLNENLDDDF